MSIRTKLFIQTLLVIVIVMIFGSLFYIKSINALFEQSTKKDIAHDTKILQNYITQIKEDIKKTTIDIAKNEKVSISLNLISKYEDKNDYKALVFNSEKLELLSSLKPWLNSKEKSTEISFYNADKELLAFASYEDKSFISWSEQKPYLNNKETKKQLSQVQKLNENCVDKTITSFKNSRYNFCYTKEIHHLDEVVGYVKTAYALNGKDFTKLKESLMYDFYFSIKQKDEFTLLQKVEVDAKKSQIIPVLAYDAKPTLYVNFIVDLGILEAQKSAIAKQMIILVVALAVFAFMISWYFSKHLIIDRLNALKEAIESIKGNRYQKVKIKQSDELGKIIEDFNDIFEKLSTNFAFLDSYKKSVDIANIVSTTDLDGKITYVNDEFVKTSGFTKEELVGKPHNIIRHPDMKQEIFKQLWETIEAGKPWRGLIKNRQKDGGHYWADSVVCPVFDSDGNIREYISIRRDVTELIEQQDRLKKLADIDSLTKLGSRNKLHNDLEQIKGAKAAIVNIDRFSQINDFYGHRFGDLVLRKFAKKFNSLTKEIFGDAALLYRPNSDEFVVLFRGEKEEFLTKLENILHTLESKKLVVGVEDVMITLSCGVSFESNKSLLLTADMALKVCKKENKSYVVYDESNSLNQVYQNNLIWTKKLKEAIEEDRIVPFFQPIVNNKTLHTDKYESLVRMIDSDGKVVSPFFFLDVAKQTKQYSTLTKIMIEKTFQAFADKKEEFSINLTAEDILSNDIALFLQKSLQKYPTVANRLVFEIVESESIDSYEEVVEFINKAKMMGCKIAIDDFGTGYSNFEHLIKLKADFIKIDGSLIKNIASNEQTKVVVSIIVSFAKQMGIQTVAEFVEDEEILKVLQDLGVDYSQGYHFSPPLQTLD